ncbi:MAG: hypothetical protein ACRD4U_01530 [Candidatus Acidiferrales bacterium]
MDELELRLLRLFDDLRKDRLDLHAFFDLVGGNRPADQRLVLAAVERLITQGCLEEKGNDFYARTDAGRRACLPQAGRAR